MYSASIVSSGTNRKIQILICDYCNNINDTVLHYYDNVMWLVGQIHLFTKSGHSVTLSASDQLIQSADAASATSFLLTRCSAWNVVRQVLRPRCVSLKDPNRTGWYVRHAGFYLRVDSEYVAGNLPLFQNDSSFILHSDSFYPDYYSLESVNYPGRYIRLRDDGRLGIEAEASTSSYMDAASFTLYDEPMSKYQYVINGGSTVLSVCVPQWSLVDSHPVYHTTFS